MAKNKSKKENKSLFETQEFAENPITVYCHFIYRFVGRKLLRNEKFKKFFDQSIYNQRYESILKKANLKLLPEEYFITVFLTLIFLLVVFLILSILTFAFSTLVSVILFYGGIAFVISLGIFMYNYPVVISKQRRTEIDAAIPYLLPYLKILGKELGLSKIIEIIDDFIIYKEIQVEFKRIKYYSEFLGYDIHSSIREAMASCPSRQLADLLNDMVTISNSGGDIYGYLDRKLQNLNIEIEAIEKKNIDTLLIYSQIYVVVLLIAPLFFTIMSSILNLVEFTADGSSPSATGSFDSILTTIIMLFALPFAYVGFMMLVYYSKPLYSRLQPVTKKK